MLSELRIRDLAIIDQLDLSFAPGFNVLTGETGAGKSIIIDAVGLLLGDRAAQEVVRAGAERAEIEGAFQLSPAMAARIMPVLTEHGLEGDDPAWLVLAREVRAAGRSVARVNGRVVATALLGEIGGRLVDIHGQSEHLSLLREREHIGLLDRYAGLEAQPSSANPPQSGGSSLQAEVTDSVRRLRSVRRELEGLRQDERERARRIDLLTYQIGEIRAARLKADEPDELEAERRRLANAEQLATLSSEATGLMQEGSEQRAGVLDTLGHVEQALTRLARLDPGAGSLAEELAEATALLDDLARELGHYRDSIEFNPQRLAQVEERLHLIHTLQRKYGDSVADVLAYAERSEAELEQISHAEERIADLEAEESKLLTEVGTLGAELSVARRAAGERMAREIEAELADLQMAHTRFAVEITWTPDALGAVVRPEDAELAGQPPGRYAFDSHGLDSVAFLVSANPGEPPRPLVKVASGGETSRLMLALKTVLGRADETPTLIFDEIDQGIGGRVGGTVGRKLWGLTAQNGKATLRHQVLCITHLPQLAAYGDMHFHVSKHVEGQRTVTTARQLDGDGRIAELAQMMGTNSEAGRASVTEIMSEAAAAKATTRDTASTSETMT
jgi:DNA repair protein RecN (Recombination protein N)